MTLKDYQQSKGIILSKQVILINNDKFPPDSNIQLGDDSFSWKNLWRTRQKIQRLNKIQKEEVKIFYGYPNRSCNDLNPLLKSFKWIGDKEKKITIILGKGDYELNSSFCEKLPSNVIAVYGNNVNHKDDRLRYLPMGRDFRSTEIFKDFLPKSQKENLVYANFSVNTHPIRKTVQSRIKDKSFIKTEHMGNFLNYSISRKTFFENLSNSKFSLCPRGNAIDTFRMWDSLYVGTIPIVVFEGVFHENLTTLPILFLQSYEELYELNADVLDDKYKEMITKSYDYSLLELQNWLPK